MGSKSGFMCKVDTGGKAIAYHNEQRPEFADIKKHYVHFMNDDFTPIIGDNGFPKKGLISTTRLSLIGYTD